MQNEKISELVSIDLIKDMLPLFRKVIQELKTKRLQFNNYSQYLRKFSVDSKLNNSENVNIIAEALSEDIEVFGSAIMPNLINVANYNQQLSKELGIDLISKEKMNDILIASKDIAPWVKQLIGQLDCNEKTLSFISNAIYSVVQVFDEIVKNLKESFDYMRNLVDALIFEYYRKLVV